MIIAIYLAATFVAAPAHTQDLALQDTATWAVYTNSRYGYEIRYPADFEVRPTGGEGRRDGGTIRIALREYAAPAPVLDIFVRENAVEASRLPETGIRDMNVDTRDIELGGARLREVTLRWKESGEIAFVQLTGPQVVFLFHANAGTADMRDTIWWKIIQTFRFRENR